MSAFDNGEGGLNRRELLRLAALGVAGWGFGKMGLGLEGIAQAAQTVTRPTLGMATNQSPAALVQAALKPLGGMSRFVHAGDTVLIKPNAAWAQPPAVAANTNPEVLAEVIRLCRQAGAKTITVMDNPCETPAENTFKINGLKPAAERAGAKMISGHSPGLYQDIALPKGRVLKRSQVLKAVRQADVFINLPIAKVHGSTPLTLGLKNLMGVTWDRGAWHNSPDLNQAIADYATVVRPHLTIMDGVRVLLSRGPRGPGKTRDAKTIIAGTDPVAVDAYTAWKIFGMAPEQVPYIKFAYAAKLGEIDLQRMIIKS
jgi:uncharacterized protein (DUF362 family)